MADRLVIVENRQGTYSIRWHLEDDDDLGATLGEGESGASMGKMERDFETGKLATDEEREHAASTLAAWNTESTQLSTSENGFFWETRKGAIAALRLAKSALKELRDNKPWPGWAKQAVKHGWKAPKGWKP